MITTTVLSFLYHYPCNAGLFRRRLQFTEIAGLTSANQFVDKRLRSLNLLMKFTVDSCPTSVLRVPDYLLDVSEWCTAGLLSFYCIIFHPISILY